MKVLMGIGTAWLAAALALPAAMGQTAAPRVHGISGEQAAETPHLGIGGQDVTSDRAKALKLKEEIGAEITSVEPDSAAAKAGLKEGDVILQYNGQKVEGFEQLRRMVHETPVHREVKLAIWRNGAEQTVAATMGGQRDFSMQLGSGPMGNMPSLTAPMPPSPPMPPQFDIPQVRTMMGTASLGIMGEALGQDSQLAEFFGVKEGVLVRQVNKDSAAEKAGMKAGDVITKIDDTAVSTPQQISAALRGARNKGTVIVTVVRNKKEMPLTVTPESSGLYRGGLWNPQYHDLLELLQTGQWQKIALR